MLCLGFTAKLWPGFASFRDICSVCNCGASEDVSTDGSVLLCGECSALSLQS